MAKGLNCVHLIGNSGGDPEVRYSQGGTAMATMTIATSESWKDKATGEQQERTEWHRVKFFGRLAEIVGEYVKKGRQVYIQGKLRTDKYDKDGVVTYSTYILGDEMQMLGPNPEGTASNRAPSSGGGQNRGPQHGENDGAKPAGNRAPQTPPSRNDDPFPEGMEDDIPF